MALHAVRIPHFTGIVQSICESEMSPHLSQDACNIDTREGRLAVATGYEQEVPGSFFVPVPGKLHRFFRWQRKQQVSYLVCSSLGIGRYNEGKSEWEWIHEFSSNAAPSKPCNCQ